MFHTLKKKNLGIAIFILSKSEWFSTILLLLLSGEDHPESVLHKKGTGNRTALLVNCPQVIPLSEWSRINLPLLQVAFILKKILYNLDIIQATIIPETKQYVSNTGNTYPYR